MTCSLTPWPSTAGKATASKAPGAVLREELGFSRHGSCLLQLLCRWLQAQAWFPSEGNDSQEKKGVLNQGEVMVTAARLIAEAVFWLGFIF